MQFSYIIYLLLLYCILLAKSIKIIRQIGFAVIKGIFYKLFAFIRNAYKIRSEIAHNYESSLDFEQKDNTLFIELLDTVRKSIILYLKNPILYSTDKLKNIPIKFEPS